MQGHKHQQKNTGIGHRGGSDGSSARSFVDDVAPAPGDNILIEEGQPGKDMDHGQYGESQFHGGNQRAQGMQMLGIWIKRIFSAVNRQISH